MNKISLTLITIITGVLLVFTFLQMERPDFEMESEFIVIPQNSIVANDMNNIINNIVNIASDQQNNELIKEKRAMVEVKRLNETSMFQVNVLAQSEKEAKELNEQVAYNILKDVSEYYDVKAGINIKLVKDGVAEKNALNGVLPIIFWALVGVLISILVVMIVELVTPGKNDKEKVVDLRNVINNVELNQEVNFGSQSQVQTKIQEQKVESAPSYNLQDSVNTKYEFNSFQDRGLEEINNAEEQLDQIEKEEETVANVEENTEDSNLTEIVEEKVVEKKVEEIKPVQKVVQQTQVNTGAGRSGAPSNLPVVEFNAESTSDEVTNETQVESSEGGSDEPTEEELKARLNKLLKGEM